MSLRRATWIWRSLLLVAWLAATWLFLTPLPPPTGAEGVPFYDKLAHVALFAVLAILARLAYPARKPAAAFLALLAYAVLIETVQPSVGRAFEAADLLAGGIGASAAFLLRDRSKVHLG